MIRYYPIYPAHLSFYHSVRRWYPLYQCVSALPSYSTNVLSLLNLRSGISLSALALQPSKAHEAVQMAWTLPSLFLGRGSHHRYWLSGTSRLSDCPMSTLSEAWAMAWGTYHGLWCCTNSCYARPFARKTSKDVWASYCRHGRTVYFGTIAPTLTWCDRW